MLVIARRALQSGNGCIDRASHPSRVKLHRRLTTQLHGKATLNQAASKSATGWRTDGWPACQPELGESRYMVKLLLQGERA